jgi:uncharacterized protein (TIGR01244 family)
MLDVGEILAVDRRWSERRSRIADIGRHLSFDAADETDAGGEQEADDERRHRAHALKKGRLGLFSDDMTSKAYRLSPMGWAALAAVVVAVANAAPRQEVTHEAVPGIRNLARAGTTVACAGVLEPAQAMPAIKKMGFVSVINLREANEPGMDVDKERQAAEAAGLKYVHLPFNYNAPDPKVADRFLEVIAASGTQPAFIHCTAGIRAAAMWMIKRLVVDRWDVDRAGQEAADLGLTSPKLRQWAIDYAKAKAEPRAAQTEQISLIRLPDGGIQPDAAVDDRGVVHVVYFRGEPAHGDLFYARLDGGQFTRPIRVNTYEGSAIATGTMRGAHIAIGRNGRVHIAWHGSDRAAPRAPGGETPVMYARLDDAGRAFEPERNVVARNLSGLDGGSIAADRDGHVYVAWHAFVPGTRGELDRRVWLARSADDGRTFATESPVSDAATGACGCCGVGALAADGAFVLLYRAAIESVHRDAYALISHDRGSHFTGRKLEEWNVNACPMSTFSLGAAGSRLVAAWETDGQVRWTRLDTASDGPPKAVAPAGTPRTRKHPSVAVSPRGDTLLVWTEGTGWSKGGSLAWQRFDERGAAVGAIGRADGVPVWSLGAAIARRDGSFAILY